MTRLTRDSENVSAQPATRFRARRISSPLVGGVLGVVCLIVLFYAEENWRGKHAWERCKRDLGAQGVFMDSPAHVPAAIPDLLNVFKAPRMTEWFLGQAPSDFTTGLARSGLSTQPGDGEVLIEVTVVSRTNPLASPHSDLCLDYDAPVLSLPDSMKTESNPSNPEQVIPLIILDDVPLLNAITNLARQEGRKYLLDSNVVWGFSQAPLSLPGDPITWLEQVLTGKRKTQQPAVTLRWENLTAFQALRALLGNYNLIWIEDPTNHVGRIAIRPLDYSLVEIAPLAREQLTKALASSLPGGARQTLKSPRGGIVYHRDSSSPGADPQPVRITVRSATIPLMTEVEAFFPRDTLPWLPASVGLRASRSGTNSFRLFAAPPHFCSAEDYLAQTDPYQPEFNLMREALKRPYARIDGKDERTITLPPRNFVSIRNVSQVLAQRAQSYLLLRQPEHALEELTLIHDLAPVIDAEPVSLVAAMIESAITGLYIEVIRDGLRLGVWGEPQLAAFQAQLGKIHLAPLLVAGLANERRAVCRTLETVSANEFASAFDLGQPPRGFLGKLKTPGYCVLAFAPRGWRYQSMAAIASLQQSGVACFDSATQTVRVSDIDYAASAVERMRKHGSMATRLAGITAISLTRPWQVMAHQQSLADQAFVASALERYRLAHGEYPPDLTQLTPAFAEQLPRDIMGGGELHYQRLDKIHFRLYSIGWNQRDDGGIAPETNSVPDYTKGDWTWN